jgi:hypothetical protein
MKYVFFWVFPRSLSADSRRFGTLYRFHLQRQVNEASRPARPRPTALLSPHSDGKPEAATATVVAPDDGRKDARNMLSCI